MGLFATLGRHDTAAPLNRIPRPLLVCFPANPKRTINEGGTGPSLAINVSGERWMVALQLEHPSDTGAGRRIASQVTSVASPAVAVTRCDSCR